MKSKITGHAPKIDDSCYVAPNATVIGDVALGEDSSIWFCAVVRGDVNSIRIGARSNVQDISCLHVDERNPLSIGDDVSIGHGVILHGCRVGRRVIIGMGATIMNGACIGSDCIIGAGALVTENAEIPSGSLVVGVPAKVKRGLTQDEKTAIVENAGHYVEYALKYKSK